ncbi:hypothetical protein BRC97_08975 [Halobacteriales archaeon QS_6_71_20]|nr:MAG: hypothetical protein BRC97_08975 [Halobacteriales archaeon QS_6_71_20]
MDVKHAVVRVLHDRGVRVDREVRQVRQRTRLGDAVVLGRRGETIHSSNSARSSRYPRRARSVSESARSSLGAAYASLGGFGTGVTRGVFEKSSCPRSVGNGGGSAGSTDG